MSRELPPALAVTFDPTPEIYATDSSGGFSYPLLVRGKATIDTRAFDEVRLVLSVWHPSAQRNIDLDRAYVELRATLGPDDEHWARLAEIEPVVPPSAGADSFDGWIVLPILGPSCAFALFGAGFEPRTRLQVRATAYFVG